MRALLVVLPLLALGCPPSDLGTTCHFSGESTACGKCIAKSCQTLIDAACDSALGSDLELPALDTCASGKGCTTLFASFGRIGTCAQAACADTCGGGTGSANVACTSAAADTCTCTAGGEANTLACVATATTSTCCADSGWPASGTCSCETPLCATEYGLCRCGPSASFGSSAIVVASCAPEPGTVCCSDPNAGTCGCGVSSCTGEYTEVSRCRASDLSVVCSVTRRAIPKCRGT